VQLKCYIDVVHLSPTDLIVFCYCSGLIVHPEGPLNPDKDPMSVSEMFRPFQTLLFKIRYAVSWSVLVCLQVRWHQGRFYAIFFTFIYFRLCIC